MHIFFLCSTNIGADSGKYLSDYMCAWLPCAAKCVFACSVDRDGDGGELPLPSSIGTEHFGRQQEA